MKVRLISVPYDSGRFMAAQGLGPIPILKAGLAGRLSANGHDISGEVIVVADPRPREITTGFAMAAETRLFWSAVADAGSGL